MAFALIAHTSVHNGTSSGIDTTGANFIVIWCTNYDGGLMTGVPTAPSDSKSNTWTLVHAYDDAANFYVGGFYYCVNPSVGTGHTFTTGSDGGFNTPSLCVAAFSGAAATPLDQQNGTNNSNPFPGTTIQLGSVTPAVDNELILSGIGFRNTTGAPVSIDSSFTLLDTNATANQCVAMAYLIQTTATAENPTWTYSVNDTGFGTGANATFKAASAGPSLLPRLTLLGAG